jgi:hypothetical protein
MALIALVIIVAVYRYRKMARRKANRIELINNLRTGEGPYKFVAFLSYSDHDENFVNDYLYRQLNETLQLMTGIHEEDRDLVCTHNMHFEIGHGILAETARCINSSSSLIAVVSDSYHCDGHCFFELDCAARHFRKPIVPCANETIYEAVFEQPMLLPFRRETRVTWRYENQQYNMNTTIEDFCSSLLDIIANMQ